MIRVLRVEVPDLPDAPGSDSIIDKLGNLAGWFADRPGAFWTLLLVGGLAFVVMAMLKRPFVRGLAVGAVILLVVALAFFN